MTPLALLFPFLSSLQSAKGPGHPIPEPTPVNKTLLLQLINDVRKKGCRCGDTYYASAPAVVWNVQLEQASLSHSSDMSANKYFAHASHDGSNPGNRIESSGYRWRVYGENIAFGYRNEQEVIDGWIKSPGHCKNIMNKAFKDMSVSRVGDYWTQDFATKF